MDNVLIKKLHVKCWTDVRPVFIDDINDLLSSVGVWLVTHYRRLVSVV